MERPEIIIVPSMFVLIGYVSWLLVTAALRKHQLRILTEFHTRLVDKLGSVQDVSAFLSSDAATRFLRDLTAEPARAANPKAKILRAAQWAAVLVCLGVGIMVTAFFSPALQGMEGLTLFGALVLALGVGFAASSAVAYRLAGSLGLLADERRATTEPATTGA